MTRSDPSRRSPANAGRGVRFPRARARYPDEYRRAAHTAARRALGRRVLPRLCCRARCVGVRLLARPVEVVEAVPFTENKEHRAYDPDAVQRCWRILLQADRVLKRFASRFTGKASPVHFFWDSFDLAYTRFSGRRVPRHPGGAPNCADYVMVEAYSHECSSVGFWPGGGAVGRARGPLRTAARPRRDVKRAIRRLKADGALITCARRR